MDCNEMLPIYKVISKGIIPIIQYAIPGIILFVSTLILLLKKGKKNYKKFIRRLVIAIMIFALATITKYAVNYYIEKQESNRQWENCWKKPIIYFYPSEKMDLDVTLINEELLLHTYPKYENKWEITIYPDGTIFDKKRKRNYYALYWEGRHKKNESFKEGFVIEGKQTVSFLEEKLSLLGLNDREINEFIIYWLPQMEDNNYNIIRFYTMDEINEIMPLEFSKNPDTLIRVFMAFKPADQKIKLPEQELTPVERKGFTIVEWGGSKIE